MDEGLKNQVLNAHFMCKEYGSRPADDLLGDSFEFALNNFVRRVRHTIRERGSRETKEKE